MFFAKSFFFLHYSDLVFPCKYSGNKQYLEGKVPELIQSHYSAQLWYDLQFLIWSSKLLLFSKSHQSEIWQTLFCAPSAPVQDAKRDEKNLPLIHQQVNADNLADAEGLLKDLFMDVDKSKKLQHPQAGEIEKEWVYCVVSQMDWHI